MDEIFDFGQYINRLQPVQETKKDRETQIIDIGRTKVVPRKETQQVVKEEATEKEILKTTKTKRMSVINQQTKSESSSSLLKTTIPAKSIKKEVKFVPNLTPVGGVVLESNIVVLGASVGGPRTITTILKELPGNLSIPILIL